MNQEYPPRLKRALERSGLKTFSPSSNQSYFWIGRTSAARARLIAASWGYFLPPLQDITKQAQEKLNTELRKAAYGGDTKAAEGLIAKGADVYAKANNGWRALEVALSNGHPETAKMLRKHMSMEPAPPPGAPLVVAPPPRQVAVIKPIEVKEPEAAAVVAPLPQQVPAVEPAKEPVLVIKAEALRGIVFLPAAAEAPAQQVPVAAPAEAKAPAELTWQEREKLDKDFIEAVNRGDAKTAEELIGKGAKVEAKDVFGRTALMAAALRGDLGSAKILIEKGADAKAKNKDNADATVLMLAAAGGHTELSELLIANGADIGFEDKLGHTALMRAVSNNHARAAELLIDKGADVNAKNKHGRTALMEAARGQAEAVRLLIAKGADVNARSERGWTALMEAAFYDQPAIAAMLIEKDAEVDAKNDDGMTALMYAAKCGNTETAEMLRKRGAKEAVPIPAPEPAPVVAAPVPQEPAIEPPKAPVVPKPPVAVQKAPVQAEPVEPPKPPVAVQKAPVQAEPVEPPKPPVVAPVTPAPAEAEPAPKAKPTERQIRKLNAELFRAAKKGDTQTAEELIAKGAQVNARGKRDKTPLILAAVNGRTWTAKMLVAKGADVTLGDKDGLTAMAAALWNNKTETAKMLEKYVPVRPQPSRAEAKKPLARVQRQQFKQAFSSFMQRLGLWSPERPVQQPVAEAPKPVKIPPPVIKPVPAAAPKPEVKEPKPAPKPAPQPAIKAETISGIALPLPNISMRPEVEELLNQWHPRYDQLGVEIEKNMLIRRVARTIFHYWFMTTPNAAGKNNGEAAPQSAEPAMKPEDVHPFYQRSVNELRHTYSDQWVVMLAARLVNENYVVGPVLTTHDTSLIWAALGDRATSLDLAAFRSMPAGVRDLRIRNFISSRLVEPDWLMEIDALNMARKMLYSKLELREATAEEKWAAVTDPAELTDFQKKVICAATNRNAKRLTSRDIHTFAVWALKPQHTRSATELWRRNRPGLFTLGHLAHKLRRSQRDYTQDEAALLQSMLETGEKSSPEAEQELCKALIEKTSDASGVKRYAPQIMKLYATSQSMRFGSLQESARMQDEWNTLLESIDVTVQRPNVRLITTNTMMMPGRKNGGPAKVSEDSAISLAIETPEGPVLVDAVFDGVGGNVNGAKASGIARNVLALSAFAGWITSAEDIRRAIITADLAITMEQIADKNHDEDVIDDAVGSRPMGSTAVVTLQKDDRLYFVHCGDSEGRVIRNGRVLFKTDNHDVAYHFRMENADEAKIAAIVRNNSNMLTSAMGSHMAYLTTNNSHTACEAIQLMPGDVIALASDGITNVVCGEHEFTILIRDARNSLAKAMEKIMELARSRNERSKDYILRCAELGVEPEIRKGKDDDMTITLRYADGGFRRRA